MTEELKLNKANQDLLDEVNDLFPRGSVFVQFHGEKSGFVRHDQAETTSLPGGLVITVTDLTEPNYTASHELLHLLMTLRGFPQIFFELSLGDKQLDEQMMIMATDLFNTVAHQIVVDQQRQHGLINEQIEQEYFKGITATLTDEGDQDDGERTLRLLTLLDALVFYAGGHMTKQQEEELQRRYPVSWASAQFLYGQAMEKPVKSPFEMRRTVVKLFRLFDTQLQQWGLPALHNNQFTSLSPVLSKRQLRLEVAQVYDIYHSEMTERDSKRRAYVVLGKNDQQNAFVLPAPKDEYSSDQMLKFYHQPVEDLLKSQNVPFILRK